MQFSGYNDLQGLDVDSRLHLERSVSSTHIAQALDSSSYMKKLLITNKVTAHFFITLSKSISCTLHALPTDLSRLSYSGMTQCLRDRHPRVYLSGIHAKQNHNGQRLTDKGECL